MTTTDRCAATIDERVHGLAWDDLGDQLDGRGFAITEPLLEGDECDALADLFEGGRFRSTIDMARHSFGDGRYRYFDHPLPDTIAALRHGISTVTRGSRTALGVIFHDAR